MVPQKKNLLEAFRASAPEGRSAAQGKQQAPAAAGGPFASGASGAGGPGATGAPATAAKPAGARVDLLQSRPTPFLQRALTDRAIQGVLVIAVAAIAVAYFVGRGQSPEEAQAAGTAGTGGANGGAAATPPAEAPGAFVKPTSAAPPAATSADAARKNADSAQLGTVHDRALYDLANSFTVRVAQYKNDEYGLKLARATVAHLQKEGYPAAQPIQTGDLRALIVCVGAKPKASELEVMADQVRQLRGPAGESKKTPFGDAYIDRIDKFLKRQ